MNTIQQNYYQHPKVLINIILINPKKNKILFVKRKFKNYWDLLGHILEYGETIEQRIKEILDDTDFKGKNMENKMKFICSFNAVDKSKQRHFVELMYIYKLEEGENVKVEKEKFQSYGWLTIDKIKTEPIFYGFEIFLEKYKIKEIKDILKVDSI